MYKKDVIKYIDELIFLSDFIAYNALGKNKKKIKKKLKKIKKHIQSDEYASYSNQDWIDEDEE